jgi:hypothetical protein
VESPPYREEYVREMLAWGWFCRGCGIWNGDEKEFLIVCRHCEHPRPRVDHVVRGTKGKR